LIYNFIQYLENEFPAELFYTNIRILISGQESIPDRNVLVKETGGLEKPWIKYVEKTVQIITRDIDTPSSRKLAWDIYQNVTSRFGLSLPAVAVDGVNYPEIQTCQISALQEPYCLGADESGRIEFTTNYKIIYKRD